MTELHNRLDRLIGKDDSKFFQKANQLIEAMVAFDATQPIHDFFIKLNLPAPEKKWDKEKWYDLAVKTSSRALLYLARADEIEAHLGGVPKTLEEAAKALGEIAYPGSKEKIAAVQNLPEGVSPKDLADYTALCVGKGIEPRAYNKGLDILLGLEFEYDGKPTKIKTKTNIPSIAVEGKDIVEKYGDPDLKQYSLKVLEPRDWRMLVMGELTNCCQSIGNNAEKCALEAMTNENCGVVAIFKGDKIVGQSFVWLGQDDEKSQKTFVFDSWERLNENLDFLCAPFYNEMALKLQADHNINKVTLGSGGNTPRDLIFNNCDQPTQYKDKAAPYADSFYQLTISNTAEGISAEKNIPQIKLALFKARMTALLNNKNVSTKDLADCISTLTKDQIKKETQLFLENAIRLGNLTAVEFFIKNGADLNAKDAYGNTALRLAIWKGETDIAKLLIDKGANLDTQDADGNTALHYAIVNGPTEAAQLLIEKGANLNMQNKDSFTALHVAIVNGLTEAAQLLIDKGANLNIQNKYGSTALHHAIRNGLTAVAKPLIDKGADVNKKDNYGSTALHCAIGKGLTEVAKLLIEKGALVNVQDKDGFTALHHAIDQGLTEVAKLLIHKGADLNVQNKNGNTALQLAIERGQTEIANLLRDAVAQKPQSAVLANILKDGKDTRSHAEAVISNINNESQVKSGR